MSPLEIISLIFAIVILVKLILLWWVFKPAFVKKFTENMFKKTALLIVCFLVVAAVLLYFLLQELSIIQIVVASLFGMVIYGLTFVFYPKGYIAVVHDVMDNKKKAWLPWLIFVLLALWVLYALFA